MSRNPIAKGSSAGTPTAARVAIVLVTLFAAGFMGLAIRGRDDWSDVVTFAGLATLALEVAWALATRRRWAVDVCCWVSVLTALPFGLVGTAIGIWLALEAAGLGKGAIEVTPVKLLLYAVWMLLLVVIPAAVGYSLTRPAARDWFNTGPAC